MNGKSQRYVPIFDDKHSDRQMDGRCLVSVHLQVKFVEMIKETVVTTECILLL